MAIAVSHWPTRENLIFWNVLKLPTTYRLVKGEQQKC